MPPALPAFRSLGCTARLLSYAGALMAATAASTVSLAKSNSPAGTPSSLLEHLVLDSE
jgi:hypothetical protein